MTFTKFLIFLLCVYLIHGFTDKPGEITKPLDNGCTITRKIDNSTQYVTVPWYEMPLPHLNCSGSGHTRLNVDGVSSDIRSISISYNGLIELHVEDLKKFKKLEKIDAKTNELQRFIADKNVTLESVVYVSLKHNKLPSIPNDALSSFPNLKVLILASNLIKTVLPNDFQFNPKIQFLYLGNNPIVTFADDWMPKLNLSGINMRGSNLKYIPIHLSTMPDLFYVDLSRNQITNVPQRAFGGKITYLQLTTNKIKTIHPKAFEGAYLLKNLDLSENLIETIKPKTFDHLKTESLQLDLYENPLVCNCSMAWFKRWEESVEDLDLSNEVLYKCAQPQRNHNKKSHEITVAEFTCQTDDTPWIDCDQRPLVNTPPRPPQPPADAESCPTQCTCYDEFGFKYFPKLEPPKPYFRPGYNKAVYPSVECVKTNLRTVPYQHIRADVKMITMSYNKLNTVNLNDFQKFKMLQKLQLKHNDIKVLNPASAGAVWANLTNFNVQSNNITSITKNHFKSFPNLKNVHLYRNKIKKFPGDLFYFNKNLSRLYLGPNPVTVFDGRILNGLTEVYALGLRNLSLKRVPTEISAMTKLRYIDLSDNLIETLKNRTFSKHLALYRAAFGHNLLTKVEVNAFNGAINLRSLDLAENYLTTLPNNCFSNISKEILNVDLFQNKFICDCNLKWLKTWISTEEDWDSTNEVRFSCEQPLNLHGKLSEDLTPEDFVCASNPVNYDSSVVCPNTGGPIALAVIVTFLVTAVLAFILHKCTFKRKYGELLNYAKHGDDYGEMGEM